MMIVTIHPAGKSVSELLGRLAALPRPAKIEARDEEPLPERPGL